MVLEKISDLVKADLAATDSFIISQLESNIPMIKQILEYVLSCGGKRTRPMVLLLCAKALNHQTEQHTHLAAVLELIHTATLLHDDVVDHSTLRRGHKTANTIWGNQASVLVGDFLYSRAFRIVTDLQHATILDIFANSTHYIAEGEILQLINCNNPDTTENFYFDIIKRKTATLFEVASQFGAILATAAQDQINAMRDYGCHLGLAYQLIDDALDYAPSSAQTGKNIGQDLSDGKTTLPLIHAMQHSEGKDLALLRTAIESGSSKDLPEILRIIESTQAIKYTAAAARRHADLGKQALQCIPESIYRDALEDLCDFVVDRSY